MKNRIGINKVVVDAPTFRHVAFEPAPINFIYGPNGSGKTTVSNEVFQRHGLSWKNEGMSSTKILLYDENFINRVVHNFDGMDPVFTFSDVNADIEDKIEMRQAELAEKKKELDKVSEDLKNQAEEMAQSRAAYEKEVWRANAAIRKAYEEAIPAGLHKNISKFVSQLEETFPQEQKQEELDSLYRMAFGKEQAQYRRYEPIPDEFPPQFDLIDIPIVSRSETPFAVFCRSLSNLDWLRQGHASYQHKAGDKCPYCSQPLPEDFEEQLASCFDESYQRDMDNLNRQAAAYKKYLDAVAAPIQANQDNSFPGTLAREYRQQGNHILDRIQAVNATINAKLYNPSEEYEIESLVELLNEIRTTERQINERIDRHMHMMADIPGQQRACSDAIWSHMAFLCRDQIQEQKGREEEQARSKAQLDRKKTALTAVTANLRREINELSKSTVNTTVAMEAINKALVATGFQGFYLREKPGAAHLYQLVRDQGDGTVTASGLSEGERHFIAFLYFYQQVVGSGSAEGDREDRIVVIDDPASSMDSNTLCVMASLVRDIIGMCRKNSTMEDGGSTCPVKQVFCLTHNPTFFRQISFSSLSDYANCSFFAIRKDRHNQSDIEECYEDINEIGITRVNRSPIANMYEDQWRTYRQTDDPVALLNAARQILVMYFLQMVGYDEQDLRKHLLEEHQADFIRQGEDVADSRTDFNIASAMIELMNSGKGGFMESMYFDASAYDQAQLRYVFRRIFEVLDSEQHYRMMMRLGSR